jgi:hypothetical protein
MAIGVAYGRGKFCLNEVGQTLKWEKIPADEGIVRNGYQNNAY